LEEAGEIKKLLQNNVIDHLPACLLVEPVDERVFDHGKLVAGNGRV
jgi:hypothetical protein